MTDCFILLQSSMWAIVNRPCDFEPQSSKFRPVTFEEFLKVLPKKELLRPSKNLEPKHQTTSPISTVQSNQFPLVFVSTGLTGNLPSNEAPLLFKLKYGMGEFVSDLIAPRLYSVCIDSFSVKKDKLTMSMNNGQSSECSSNSEEIHIKEEPLDSDEESIDETSLNSRNVKESSIMPVIIKAYSCEDSSTATENGSCVAGSFNFPLKFVLAGSINDSSVKTRPLVYVLKQGSNGIYVTRDAMPQIFSVQINSSNQATFKVQDDAMAFKTEGPLNVHVKVERSPKNSNVVSHDIKVKEEPLPLPVILNVSSCNNNLLSDTYESEISNETENDELVSSDIKNCAVSSNGHLGNDCKSAGQLGNDCKSASEINYNTNDEDYRFLLSLLPDLKRLPPNEKNAAKKKIQDIILTSRLISSKVQFEKRNTNIYRDCGVLPISGGWKF
ncbi:BESS domain-containing protein [Trichonephila clavipes]|nr:BESS domain-containing protein [Trichonephila clavipes]